MSRSDNPFVPGGHAELESELQEAPEAVSKAFETWRNAEESLKRHEALKHIDIKAKNPEMTSTDVKAHVTASDDIFQERLEVIKLEAEYTKLSLRHLADKKRASFRTQF